jgi:hypothetical protein
LRRKDNRVEPEYDDEVTKSILTMQTPALTEGKIAQLQKSNNFVIARRDILPHSGRVSVVGGRSDDYCLKTTRDQ